MTDKSFSVNIGRFKCTVISDGFIGPSGPPPPRPSGVPEGPAPARMDVSCLLIDTEGPRILVDTGCGRVFSSSSGKLLENLAKEGIEPDSIDLIVYTHAHPDHVGGTFDSNGRLAFPKARQAISKKEWDYLSGPDQGPTSRMFALARETLLPIGDQFRLIDGDEEVTPGIKLLPASGHTPGGVFIEVLSGNDRMLCIGDLIHSRLEFTKPGFFSFLDSAPDEALKLRTEGLSKMAESGALVFACHMPFPGIGRFVRQGGVLDWQPI